MKFLALSDLHASEELLDRLRALASKPESNYDAVLICGDLTNRGPVYYAEEVISLFPKCFAVHGNMDPPEVAAMLEQNGVSVHGKKVKFGEWNIAGVGGSNPTPFDTPSELSEEQIADELAKASIDEFTVVLSHPPPYGIFDNVGQMNVGSKAVRKMLEEKKPILLICGHIHENIGKQVVGSTFVVKLPPAEKLQAAEIKINDTIDVKFISL